MTGFTSVLLRIASLVCSDVDRTGIVEPLLADWQREYRDAHSHSRLRAALVIIRGTLAFARTLLTCANPFRGIEGVPARRFALAILGFAVAATFIQSAPFQTMQLRAHVFRVDIYYAFPRFFAVGIVLAMLPAAMLAADRLLRSRFIIVIGLALSTAFVASDVVAPVSERLQREHRIRSLLSADRAERLLRSEAEYARVQQTDATGAMAWSRRLDRHGDAAVVVLAIAFGLLGAAISRSRRAAGTPPRVAVATAWWFFVWIAYQVVGFWAGRLRHVLAAPAEVAIWLPPLVFLTIAMVASVRTAGLPPSLNLWRTRHY